ncbi:MAG: 50S ribosomal protein L6 [Limnochordia bacterium]|jgi:large subunit ribosomal protein L6|nr:50S ribosomal protein L6 [Bacillota bacterium]HOB09149.1 50S ribosomal protein L6 [Limnochordia bacterium]NLH31851.1 50S ribosomal protein L6 [Bacillota bacterium]HPT92927.1 50S ribosomal protein L6 [Limnochordia bacterium]HPZ31271.1 50S ribosomal protein L6 [Limnochordia bacterium]
MSRIGKQPVKIPAGVEVTQSDHQLTVKGPKGTLVKELHPDMNITVENGEIRVTRPSDEKEHRSLHGLTRTLIANMIEGVTKGFERNLEIVGVGYRAQKQGNKLVLSIGYSHPVEIVPEAGMEIDVPAPNRITVRGIDKELVGQLAANIRKVRPPEPYLGKGIRYEGERVIRKAGKAGKAGR